MKIRALNNKKGDLRSLETVAVLIIFFIILTFGMSFFFNFQKVSFKRSLEEFNEKRAISLAENTLLMPELSCSKLGAVKLCIDEVKLSKASQILTQNRANFYFDLLGNAKITIKKVYPELNEQGTTIYDFSSIQGESQTSITRIPITLYDPLADKNSFAYIEVTLYH